MSSTQPADPTGAAPHVRALLHDLLAQADAAKRLTARGRAAYEADEMLQLAGEAILVRLGECVAKIDSAAPDFITAPPTLELRKLKDSRHVVAHGYDIVDAEIVWAILANHVPDVAAAIAHYLTQH